MPLDARALTDWNAVGPASAGPRGAPAAASAVRKIERCAARHGVAVHYIAPDLVVMVMEREERAGRTDEEELGLDLEALFASAFLEPPKPGAVELLSDLDGTVYCRPAPEGLERWDVAYLRGLPPPFFA